MVTDIIRRAAIHIRDMFIRDVSVNITTTAYNTQFKAGMDFLLSSNVISQAGLDAVLALNTSTVTFLSKIGLNQIQPIDLQIARSM